MKVFKVLSLLQPWASLVVSGHKKIETRTWTTAYRGRLLIHASAKKPDERILNEPFQKHYNMLLATGNIKPYNQLPCGAIIGEVKLAAIFKTTEVKQWQNIETSFGNVELSRQELAFDNYLDGRFAWVFTNAFALNKPIAAKGRLHLWHWQGSNSEFL